MVIFEFLISNASALGGALLTILLGHRLVLSQKRQARKAEAAFAFRSELNQALAEMPPLDAHWQVFDGKVQAFLKTVTVAVNNYKYVLSSKSRGEFELIFLKFKAQVENEIPRVTSPGEARQAKQVLMTLISQLLAYAPHK